MANYENISNLFQNEAFQAEAKECKTMDDFHALFNRHGAEISEEETIELISQIAEKRQQMDNGELAEEDLDNVAGGIVLTGGLAIAACVGVGALCVGAFAISAYNAYHALRWKHK